MRLHVVLAAFVALIAACGHSDAFTPPAAALGPATTGPDVKLTFNTDQDYWPSWTEDGQGILYAFVTPGTNVGHRCMGLLPAAGGTRLWEACDTRAVVHDSITSFGGYALGSDGRLIYSESVSRSVGNNFVPDETGIWLADSAQPFRRVKLFQMPADINGVLYSTLVDIAWTGPATFMALAQDFSVLNEARGCPFNEDSLFSGLGAVVSGVIANGAATLNVIAGTTGATSYSLAESGASVAFTRANDLHLYKVAIGGGSAAIAAILPGDGGNQLLGVSCKGTTCLVANSRVLLATPTACPANSSGASTLMLASLSSGAVQIQSTTGGVPSLPKVSPNGGAVALQIGGGFGHVQTYVNPTNGDIHLLSAVLP